MLAEAFNPLTVIPAQAGIQGRSRHIEPHGYWIPAYAGMTRMKGRREPPPLTPALSPEGRGRKQLCAHE